MHGLVASCMPQISNKYAALWLIVLAENTWLVKPQAVLLFSSRRQPLSLVTWIETVNSLTPPPSPHCLLSRTTGRGYDSFFVFTLQLQHLTTKQCKDSLIIKSQIRCCSFGDRFVIIINHKLNLQVEVNASLTIYPSHNLCLVMKFMLP